MAQGKQNNLPLPEGMPPQMLTWRWYAKVYGFTPEQVEELPLDVLVWFPVIEEAEASAQETLHRQEMRAQQAAHRSR